MDPQLALLLASAIPGVSGAGGFPPAPVTGSAIGSGPLVDSRLAAMAPKQPALPAAAPPSTPAAEPSSDASQAASDQPATTVQGVDVVAPNPHPKTSAPINYDNSAAVAGAQSAIGAANAAARNAPAGPAQGGSDNPGVFGMLPQSMQHGTLRNVIGALGDAFLVAGNKQPEYEQRMQRQEIGNAMAGVDPTDPASMTAAATRIAATGAPGADQMAAQLVEKAQQARLATLMQQQNFQYKQGMLQDRDLAVQSQAADRQDRDDDRKRGIIGGVLQAAAASGDPNKFAAARAQVLKLVGPNSRIDPSEIPESMADYQAGYGMNANQVRLSADRAAGRAQAGRDTDVNAQSRVQAAGMRPGPQPSPTGYLESLITKPAAERSPEEQQYVTKALTPTGRGSRRPVPGGAPVSFPINPATGRPYSPFSAEDAAKLPKGTPFYGKDGKKYIR